MADVQRALREVDATVAVENEIASNQKQFTDEQASNLRTALQNRQTRLEIAADAAGNVGAPERALIAFLRKEKDDIRLTTAEQLSFKRAFDEAVQKQKDALAGITKASEERTRLVFDLKEQILETKLSAADLTPTVEDNKRIFGDQIALLNEEINNNKKVIGLSSKDVVDQKTIARIMKTGTAEQIDALVQIQKDQQRINGIKQQIKGLTDQSSTSLQDLFNESIKELQDFGSNVSSQVQTSASVRAAFAGSISVQNPKLTEGQRMQLAETSESNTLLAQILAAIKFPRAQVPGGPVSNDPRPTTLQDPVGLATVLQSRRLVGIG